MHIMMKSGIQNARQPHIQYPAQYSAYMFAISSPSACHCVSLFVHYWCNQPCLALTEAMPIGDCLGGIFQYVAATMDECYWRKLGRSEVDERSQGRPIHCPNPARCDVGSGGKDCR